MTSSATHSLKRLEALKGCYGDDAGARKVDLLRVLERRRFARARDVLALHEFLCFLRAYPDDSEVLECVEGMLDRFDTRSDLRRHREHLADTGIAGTTIHFRFYWITACWLAQHWPGRLAVDWADLEHPDRLERLLPLLVAYYETPALESMDLPLRDWLKRLKGRGETDASFLIRRFEALRMDSFSKELIYDDVDLPIVLSAGRDTPSRTRARYSKSPVVFQTTPLERGRPSLADEARRPPGAVRAVSVREGQRLIGLAREAMVTRSRDLDAFAYADPRDVRRIDCGDGLEFVCLGTVPERRLMLEAVYGFLTLKNGVPIGYVLASALMGSSEIAYNVFDTYRGAEAGRVFGRVIAMVRDLFGSDTFAIDPYQLGYGNEEGLKSGAWWFYYKLGFRPDDPGVRRVVRGELRKIKADPRHRSDIATLETMASEFMFRSLGRSREDVLGRVSLGPMSLRLSRLVGERFGADRARATRECAREATRLVGIRSTRNLSSGERQAWERWGPLVVCLEGIERWTAAQKRALVKVIRAKGGRRESEFVRLFDAHRRLRGAILRLAAEEA